MAEMFGNNLYGILVFNENDELIDSLCNCCFEESYKKDVLKLTRDCYKRKIEEWFYK